MALNVEQITSRLAQMPDAALQKYAAMNKNDPYIMALAVSESNRRKQMRQAAQGAQGQMPQPKVVDAAVQSMAQPMPEDMGIARLPAGDMNFADGGIVAFADGGEVERYQFGGSTAMVDRILQKPPQARTPEENAMLAQAGYDVQTRTLGPDSGVSGINTFLQGIGPRMRDYFTGGASRLSDEELSQKPAAGGAATERILRGMGMGQATAPLGPQASYSNEGRREPMAAATPAAPAAPAAKTDTAQRGPRATSTSGAPGATAVANPNLDVEALTKKALETAAKAPNPHAADIEAVGKEKVAAAEAGAKGLKAIHDKFSDIYKGREERLNKREAELGKMKDQNLGLALLQAGAAMMSTVGNVGTAIGRGIDTGSKQYVAGLDKLNAAKEKLSDARDRLDDLNAQRGELTAREQLKAENDIRTAGISAREDLIKSNMQMYGVNRETALKMVDNQIQVSLAQFKEAEATKRSAAQISATLNSPERLVFNSLLQKHKGDAAAAYAEMQSAKREPISRDAALKNWTTNQMMITAQNPNIKTFEDYYAQVSGGAGGAGGFKYLGVSQ